MDNIPESIETFLKGKRIAVAGVSRNKQEAANVVFRRLKASGYEVYPINPNASEVEGVPCFAGTANLPNPVDGVVIATHPDVSLDIVRQCHENGVERVWFHRSFGTGSVSSAAVEECEALGMDCIVGGCPLMFCEPVDLAHKCMRWWLQRKDRIPK